MLLPMEFLTQVHNNTKRGTICGCNPTYGRCIKLCNIIVQHIDTITSKQIVSIIYALWPCTRNLNGFQINETVELLLNTVSYFIPGGVCLHNILVCYENWETCLQILKNRDEIITQDHVLECLKTGTFKQGIKPHHFNQVSELIKIADITYFPTIVQHLLKPPGTLAYHSMTDAFSVIKNVLECKPELMNRDLFFKLCTCGIHNKDSLMSIAEKCTFEIKDITLLLSIKNKEVLKVVIGEIMANCRHTDDYNKIKTIVDTSYDVSRSEIPHIMMSYGYIPSQYVIDNNTYIQNVYFKTYFHNILHRVGICYYDINMHKIKQYVKLGGTFDNVMLAKIVQYLNSRSEAIYREFDIELFLDKYVPDDIFTTETIWYVLGDYYFRDSKHPKINKYYSLVSNNYAYLLKEFAKRWEHVDGVKGLIDTCYNIYASELSLKEKKHVYAQLQEVAALIEYYKETKDDQEDKEEEEEVINLTNSIPTNIREKKYVPQKLWDYAGIVPEKPKKKGKKIDKNQKEEVPKVSFIDIRKTILEVIVPWTNHDTINPPAKFRKLVDLPEEGVIKLSQLDNLTEFFCTTIVNGK